MQSGRVQLRLPGLESEVGVSRGRWQAPESVYTGAPGRLTLGFTAQPQPRPLHLTTGSLPKLFTLLAPPQILASAP